ncbi:hypothetical protein [Arsenophonus endosymbiont of Aleurodicus dispersus]
MYPHLKKCLSKKDMKMLIAF